MKVAWGLLQDRFVLSGEYQAFEGWTQHAMREGIEGFLFGPAGEPRARLLGHPAGEFLFSSVMDQWRLIQQGIVAVTRADHIHLFVPTPNFVWIAETLQTRVPVPVSVTCLGLRPELSWHQKLALLRRDFRFYALRLAAAYWKRNLRNNCVRYHAFSREIEDQLVWAGISRLKIQITPPLLPVEEERSFSGLSSVAAPTFLYIGHFLPNKGIDVMLKALASMSSSRARLELAWSGLGNRGMVEQWIRRHRLGNRVTIRTRPVQRSSIMRQSIALLLPFEVAFGQISPPLLIWEAFRAGVPVISSRHPVILEYGKENETVYTVPPKDIRAWAQAMQNILDHPDEGKVIAERQRQRYAELTASHPLQSFYTDVTRRTHGE